MTDAALRELERAFVATMGAPERDALAVARQRAGLCNVVVWAAYERPHGPNRPDFTGLANIPPALVLVESLMPAHRPGERPTSCRGYTRETRADGKTYQVALPGTCAAFVEARVANAHRGGMTGTWRARALVLALCVVDAMPGASDQAKRRALRRERWSENHATGKRAWQEASRLALGLPLRTQPRAARPTDAPLPLFGDA